MDITLASIAAPCPLCGGGPHELTAGRERQANQHVDTVRFHCRDGTERHLSLKLAYMLRTLPQFRLDAIRKWPSDGRSMLFLDLPARRSHLRPLRKANRK